VRVRHAAAFKRVMRTAGLTGRLVLLSAGMLVPAIAAGQGTDVPTPTTVESKPPEIPRQPPASAQPVAAVAETTPASEHFTLTYNNRPITILRARVLLRPPRERAEAIVRRLDALVDEGLTGPISTQKGPDGVLVLVASRPVFGLAPADVDELAGETLDTRANQAVVALGQALTEAVELRTPSVLLRGALQALAATLAFLALLWGIRRAHGVAATRLVEMASHQLERFPVGDPALVRASRVLEFARRLVTLATLAAAVLVTYSWLTFVLRRFPYTRPWGESLREFFFSTAAHLGLGFMRAMPGLFTVAVIFLITRFFVRLANLLFEAVEQNRVSLPWVHPETAQPTRRLVVALLWLFAVVVAYPHLPGSGTDAFKGVSVFVGLMISLGSSGVISQMMSSFMITYSRALKVGDYVRVGDVEGTVTHMGMLSTKVKTPKREEVTIPNSVLVSNTTTNFSKFSESDGVYVPTSLTIGYDTPWRQVEGLLLTAADRTPGVRRQPKPVVFQTALQDFYVQYTLLVSLEKPDLRGPILNALHANIQDAFNEHGVQIMSPNYEADPAGPKIVPKERWFDAPSRPDPSAAPGEPR
jgi:small-conductance mechanosensitive channel